MRRGRRAQERQGGGRWEVERQAGRRQNREKGGKYLGFSLITSNG
jgi:hypothetical protein